VCPVRIVDAAVVEAVRAGLPAVEPVAALTELLDLLSNRCRLQMPMVLRSAGELCVLEVVLSHLDHGAPSEVYLATVGGRG
jgi:hypothetical protein